MGFLSRKRNKKFGYSPRYYDMGDVERPFQIKHRFDEHRKTVHKLSLKQKFLSAFEDYKSGSDAGVKFRLVMITAVLVLLFGWLLGFDLSIFG